MESSLQFHMIDISLNKLFNTTYLLKNKTLEKFEGNYDYIKEKML